MTSERADRLDRPVDPGRDHVLGGLDGRLPEVTLVEYGSYVCPYCHGRTRWSRTFATASATG